MQSEILIKSASELSEKIKKQLDLSNSVSSTCCYPYWNDSGIFIRINDTIPNAPYSGRDSSGPKYIGKHFNRKIFGTPCLKVASFAEKFNGKLYKYYDSYFILIK